MNVFQDGTTSVSLIENNILHLFANGVPDITVSKDLHLKLLNNGRIAQTGHAIIWKGANNLKLGETSKYVINIILIGFSGTYNNVSVACKLVDDKKYLDDEMKIFKALKATENLDMEPHEVPKIYYHGKMLDKYHGIAMTLFDGTLLDRYLQQNEKLSDFSILMIFKQAVCEDSRNFKLQNLN